MISVPLQDCDRKVRNETSIPEQDMTGFNSNNLTVVSVLAGENAYMDCPVVPRQEYTVSNRIATVESL